jgi:Rieske Fe-S protein
MGVCTHLGCVPLGAGEKAKSRANSAAISAPAMVRTMTLQAVFAKVPLPLNLAKCLLNMNFTSDTAILDRLRNAIQMSFPLGK